MKLERSIDKQLRKSTNEKKDATISKTNYKDT